MGVTPKTSLAQLAERPEVARYLLEEWGLHCVNCMLRGYDTLEAGMRLHGYGEDEIAEALAHVNAMLQ